jgi:hypothetical protein
MISGGGSSGSQLTVRYGHAPSPSGFSGSVGPPITWTHMHAECATVAAERDRESIGFGFRGLVAPHPLPRTGRHLRIAVFAYTVLIGRSMAGGDFNGFPNLALRMVALLGHQPCTIPDGHSASHWVAGDGGAKRRYRVIKSEVTRHSHVEADLPEPRHLLRRYRQGVRRPIRQFCEVYSLLERDPATQLTFRLMLSYVSSDY